MSAQAQSAPAGATDAGALRALRGAYPRLVPRAASAILASAFSWLARRQAGAGSQAPRQEARSSGPDETGFRAPAGPMSAEPAALARELAATALRLRECESLRHREPGNAPSHGPAGNLPGWHTGPRSGVAGVG